MHHVIRVLRKIRSAPKVGFAGLSKNQRQKDKIVTTYNPSSRVITNNLNFRIPVAHDCQIKVEYRLLMNCQKRNCQKICRGTLKGRVICVDNATKVAILSHEKAMEGTADHEKAVGGTIAEPRGNGTRPHRCTKHYYLSHLLWCFINTIQSLTDTRYRYLAK